MRTLYAVPTLLLALSAMPLTAQGGPSGSTAPRPWTVSTRFDVAAEFDDNVFLLPTNRKDNLASPSAADQQSGRYDQMRSPSDVIVAARAAVEFLHAGLGGRDLAVTPGVGYEFFAQNAERRNLSASFTLSQDLRRDGRVRLRAGYRPGYFARNYLTDASDANADGTITPDERRYARGDHREFDVEADYRLRLVRSRRSRPFGAFLAFAVGYEGRAYDAPFAARDFGGPTAGLRLDLSPSRGVEFQTSYDVAFLSSQVSPQVILLDEPAFGEDLNGNGNATDLNARAVRTVDRSRTEHVLAEEARFDIGRRSDLELRVAYRIREFSSSEPYDVANNGRRDQRFQVGAEFRRRIAKDVRLISGLRYGAQQLNRRTDLGAEGAVDDYTKLQAHIGVRVTP
jgi:hypothetical protein